MGITNLRCGIDLIGRAGPGIDQVALIPEPAVRAIYLDPHPSSIEELEMNSKVLLLPKGQRNRWIQLDGPRPVAPGASWIPPRAMSVPVARLTSGLREFWKESEMGTEYGVWLREPDDLTYIAVIQGTPGGDGAKVIRRDSRKAIASALFHELVNGFSVVFAGAILRSEDKFTDQTIVWERVKSYMDLKSVRESNIDDGLDTHHPKGGERTVGIVC
jgi:hypothetical protein